MYEILRTYAKYILSDKILDKKNDLVFVVGERFCFTLFFVFSNSKKKYLLKIWNNNFRRRIK